MKVFISWSGEISQKVAVVLRDWLPSVIQSVRPFVSSEDIDKGTRWSSEVAGELSESSYGIICITSDNIQAPWINFEAGALSKAIDKSRVSPFLFNVKRSDVSGPLVQFQSTLYEKQDILKLVESINNSETQPLLSPDRLKEIFEVWWPLLENELSKVPKKSTSIPASKEERKEHNSEIMEELLALSRRQSLLLSDPTKLMPPEYIISLIDRQNINQENFSHPAIFEIIEAIEILERSYGKDIENQLLISRFLSDVEDAKRFIRNKVGKRRSR